MSQLLIQDTLLKFTANFNDIENIIVTYDDKPFQNDEKWIENFDDVISLFNLNDLCKLILSKRCMAEKRQKYRLKMNKN